jgi:hypothetical protein
LAGIIKIAASTASTSGASPRAILPLPKEVAMFRKLLLATAAVVSLAGAAHAQEKYQIAGTFEGCDYDRIYRLTDGRILTCHSYGYHYAYRPEVIQLNHGRVVIDGEFYEATIGY